VQFDSERELEDRLYSEWSALCADGRFYDSLLTFRDLDPASEVVINRSLFRQLPIHGASRNGLGGVADIVSVALLAKRAKESNLWVPFISIQIIELKNERAGADHVAQLARYVVSMIAETQRAQRDGIFCGTFAVNGLLIAPSIDECVVPLIELAPALDARSFEVSLLEGLELTDPTPSGASIKGWSSSPRVIHLALAGGWWKSGA
jgi:hypothetical protein